jgi:hypothetical protein
LIESSNIFEKNKTYNPFLRVINKRKITTPAKRTRVPSPKVTLNPNFKAITPMHKPDKTSPNDPVKLLKDKRVALCSEGMCLLKISRNMGSENPCNDWEIMKKMMATRGLWVRAINKRLIPKPA